MSDLFGSIQSSQPTLDFPASLTDRYRPRTIDPFIGLAKPKALCSKLAEEDHARPAIATAHVFRGHQGTLATELWNAENKSLRGTIAPIFYTAACTALNFARIVKESNNNVRESLMKLECELMLAS